MHEDFNILLIEVKALESILAALVSWFADDEASKTKCYKTLSLRLLDLIESLKSEYDYDYYSTDLYSYEESEPNRGVLKTYTTPVMDTLLLKQYYRVERDWTTSMHTLHSTLVLYADDLDMEEAVDKLVTQAMLHYMTFYSVQYATGKLILDQANIEYKNIAFVKYDNNEEAYTVYYI